MEMFFFTGSFWNSVVFVILVIENLIALSIVMVWGIYRGMYRYDAGAYIEKANGAVVYRATRARIWLESAVKKIRLFWIQHKTHPSPTLDAIMIGNKGPRVEYLVDIYGNLHSIKPRTRFVPILVEEEGELKQLRAEMPEEKQRKTGWMSSLANFKGMFVREAKTFDEKGKEKKEMIALKEIVFEPDDSADKAWAYMELVNNFKKHMTNAWEEYKGPIIIGAIAIVAIAALVFTGYYMTKITEHTVTQCNTEAARAVTETWAEKLGTLLPAGAQAGSGT